MHKTSLAMVAVVVLAFCGGDGDGASPADTLTRAQKDSIVSELPVPGAGAVGAAMRARDRAAERAGTLDTIR